MAKGLPRSLAHARAGNEPAPRRVRYPVRDLTINVAAAGAGVGFGTAVLGDLPEGNILFLGAVGYLQFETADTDIAATWGGDYAVGTAPDADGTLSGAEVNVLASAAVGPAVARVSPVTRGASAADATEVLDNTDGSLELNLNLLVDAANITDATDADFTVNGVVELVYIVLGDD